MADRHDAIIIGGGHCRTAIRGLCLCGASTHPGGGVSRIPGYNAAREILRDARRPSFMRYAG
jgi:hypothetical protein